MVPVAENQIEAAGAVMSCSPAYIALVSEALAAAGRDEGLDAELSHQLVVDALAGTAELLRSRDPAAIRHAVASPGGATEAGLDALAERDLEAAIHEAVEASLEEDARVTLLALTRDDIADYVSAVFLVYLILIFARILLSWIPRIPYNPYLRAVVDFIHQVTDPYLNLFRRVLPPVGGAALRSTSARYWRSCCC